MLASEISVTQLVSEIHHPALRILYTTSNHAAASKPQSVIQQPSAFIPGSQLFDFKDVIVDKHSDLTNTMPCKEVFEQEVRRLGINVDTDIVVYDDIGNFCASRVWFMFKSMGHDSIKVLSGGLGEWLSTGASTQDGLSNATALGNFKAHPNPHYQFVDKDFIAGQIACVDKPQLPLFDARSAPRFSGAVPEQDPRLRSGHIFNSGNIHYQRLQEKNGAYLPIQQIKEIFQDATPDDMKHAAMAFTCGSGVTACILAQAADAVGYSPLYVYDGSWSEWGKCEELPMSTGE
ncbi:sulfurtransferase [Glaciecola sp. SC05]|uniref:sulfurtransferase n=1 Tax=Glaciecola sp. SC05 TaxID=1987355 RepID=UPI0035276B37